MEGCEAIEGKIAYFAEREIRRRRFADDIKRRLALLPISLGLGAMANYLLQATYILPAIAPEGFKIEGNEIKIISIYNVITYTRLHGSRLDRIDNEAIAFVTFEVGMCYFENEDWGQAANYFENLRESIYELYIGEENLLILLGECYYMLGLYNKSLANYRCFLKVSSPDDHRRGRVKRQIRTIETLMKKGLWGMEGEEN